MIMFSAAFNFMRTLKTYIYVQIENRVQQKEIKWVSWIRKMMNSYEIEKAAKKYTMELDAE